MPSDPLTSWTGVAPGSIVIVAAKLRSKKFGEGNFWWKSFRVVTHVQSRTIATTVVLRMVIDIDKDERATFLSQEESETQVVTLLADYEIPQGVSAMLMKGLTLGTIVIVPI